MACGDHVDLDLMASAFVTKHIQVFLQLVQQRLYVRVLVANEFDTELGLVEASQNYLDLRAHCFEELHLLLYARVPFASLLHFFDFFPRLD